MWIICVINAQGDCVLPTKVKKVGWINCILFYQLHKSIVLHPDPLPQQFDLWGYINSFSYSIIFCMAQPMGNYRRNWCEEEWHQRAYFSSFLSKNSLWFALSGLSILSTVGYYIIPFFSLPTLCLLLNIYFYPYLRCHLLLARTLTNKKASSNCWESKSGSIVCVRSRGN